MKLLVTAGNTLVPIDRVRCITNIFSGKTGAAIALEAHARGHEVLLVTSHPEAVAQLQQQAIPPADRWALRRYSTFEDLRQEMAEDIAAGRPDVVIHCAAVSDYLSAGIYAPQEGTIFRPEGCTWHGKPNAAPTLLDRQAGKVKSDEPELWLRLVRAPKLIDCVRGSWGFTGLLVKFKLEVGVAEDQLLDIAERSRKHSQANLMVANTLEGAASHAFIGPVEGEYQKVSRRELAGQLLGILERLREAPRHG